MRVTLHPDAERDIGVAAAFTERDAAREVIACRSIVPARPGTQLRPCVAAQTVGVIDNNQSSYPT